MPDTAALIARVECPACGNCLTELCRVQWGVVPRQAVYQLGDKVEWHRLPDGGIVPPFRLQLGQWNCGDPASADVLLKDPTCLGGPLLCPACAARYEGIVVEVSAGRFRSARLYAAGEFADEVDIFEKLPDGSLRPRLDWVDHPVFLYGSGD